jgi:hypothetical protein
MWTRNFSATNPAAAATIKRVVVGITCSCSSHPFERAQPAEPSPERRAAPGRRCGRRTPLVGVGEAVEMCAIAQDPARGWRRRCGMRSGRDCSASPSARRFALRTPGGVQAHDHRRAAPGQNQELDVAGGRASAPRTGMPGMWARLRARVPWLLVPRNVCATGELAWHMGVSAQRRVRSRTVRSVRTILPWAPTDPSSSVTWWSL